MVLSDCILGGYICMTPVVETVYGLTVFMIIVFAVVIWLSFRRN